MRKRPSVLNDYNNFVNTVTSDASKNTKDFKDALDIMEEKGIDPSRLLTASVGLSGEVGEFNDIVKKLIFQGKEIDDDTKKHLKSELGDICWYMAQALIALDSSWEEIFDINVGKLSERYPGGFDALKSASRKVGDI
jgi:NTP pyrophosphatase (non-canonical NTP hydrolase)